MGLFSKKKEPAEAKAPQFPNSANRQESLDMDRNLSCEEMDSDDLDGDLNLSDEDNGTETRNQIRQRTDAAAK